MFRPEHMKSPKFIFGLLLLVLAASMMLIVEAPMPAPITLLIVGIVLIGASRR